MISPIQLLSDWETFEEFFRLNQSSEKRQEILMSQGFRPLICKSISSLVCNEISHESSLFKEYRSKLSALTLPIFQQIASNAHESMLVDTDIPNEDLYALFMLKALENKLKEKYHDFESLMGKEAIEKITSSVQFQTALKEQVPLAFKEEKPRNVSFNLGPSVDQELFSQTQEVSASQSPPSLPRLGQSAATGKGRNDERGVYKPKSSNRSLY